MSPIYIRPVREQIEHDRIIRQLHAKARRKHDALMNVGQHPSASVGAGDHARFPDLILCGLDKGNPLEMVVEVETAESVHRLEALGEWVPFAAIGVPFVLYVPASMVEVARQLCTEHKIRVAELWSYIGVGDDVRFTLIHRDKPQAAPKKLPAVVRLAPPVPVPVAAPPPPAAIAAGTKPKPITVTVVKSGTAKPTAAVAKAPTSVSPVGAAKKVAPAPVVAKKLAAAPKPVVKVAKKVAAKPVAKVVKKAAAVKKPVAKVAKKSAARPVAKKVVKKPAAKIAKKSAAKPVAKKIVKKVAKKAAPAGKPKAKASAKAVRGARRK